MSQNLSSLGAFKGLDQNNDLMTIFVCNLSIISLKQTFVVHSSKFGLFYPDLLTLSFPNILIQKYSKTPNYSARHHTYSFFSKF